MHRQIDDAVPWPVAMAIGRELKRVLVKKWFKDRENAIAVE
jgi:DNA (cytosine-5)-methyltransferase 1